MSVFCYDNVLTRDTTNLSLNTGDENASYPLTNIQHIHLSKTYQSVSGTTVVKILIDAGETVDVDYFMIRSADGFNVSSMTINGNASDSWGAPSFSQAVDDLNDTYNFGYEAFSSTQSYRYWLLEVTASGSYVELANIFLGPKVDNLDSQDLSQGWTHVVTDSSNVQISVQGQRYFDELPDIAQLTAKMILMDETETAAIDAMYAFCGIRKPIWLIPTIDNSIKYSNQYFFVTRPQWVQDRYRLHSTTFVLTEAK